MVTQSQIEELRKKLQRIELEKYRNDRSYRPLGAYACHVLAVRLFNNLGSG
jgi:hypothetical protein